MTRAEDSSTKSEHLFEKFCDRHGIDCQPIPRAVPKTPDYEIVLAGHTVVTEVKQLNRNKEDDELWARARRCGSASGWSLPGRRVRYKIGESGKQLKARAKGVHPALLVLYDNGSFGGTDYTDIKTAMYGDEKAVVSLGDESVNVTAIHAGGGRKCTKSCNTSISAIGLLCCCGEEARLLIFHNHFAAIPLNPDWLRLDSVQQFTLDPTDLTADYAWVSI